jgi:hypothetical protein
MLNLFFSRHTQHLSEMMLVYLRRTRVSPLVEEAYHSWTLIMRHIYHRWDSIPYCAHLSFPLTLKFIVGVCHLMTSMNNDDWLRMLSCWTLQHRKSMWDHGRQQRILDGWNFHPHLDHGDGLINNVEESFSHLVIWLRRLNSKKTWCEMRSKKVKWAQMSM